MSNTLIIVFSYLATFLFPLGQLGRISFLNQQVNIYLYEIVLAIALLSMVVKYGIEPLRKTPLFMGMYFLLGILFLSFLVGIPNFDRYANGIGLLYLIRLSFYFFYFIYLVTHIKTSKKGKNDLFNELRFIVFIIIITSWLQYLFYPNLRNLFYAGWDPHLYRVFSFFFEPYLAGAALGISFYFVYFRMYQAKKHLYLRVFLLVTVFILVMLTFSRTVYLATMMSLTGLFVIKRKFKLIAVVLGAFIFLTIVIPKPLGVGVQLLRTFSIETRIKNAVEGIVLWTKQPILGVGYDRIRYKRAQLGLAGKYDSSHAAATFHSSFVTILVTGGIVGLVAFLYVLWSLMKVSVLSTVVIAFLSILSFGDNALLQPFMLFLYLKLIALETAHSSLA